MSYSIVFSRKAERSLARLISYLGTRFSVDNAQEFADKLVIFCERFITFPHRGTERPDLGPELRTIGYRGKVTILFRVSDRTQTVTILDISYRGRMIKI